MNLHYRKHWLAMGWFFIGVLIVLSLIPNPPNPMEFKQHDKLNHLLGYGWVMLWFGQLYARWSQRLIWAIGLMVLGVTLEVLQGLTAYRHFEVVDMMANGLGVAVGMLLALTPLRHMLAAAEAHWLKETV